MPDAYHGRGAHLARGHKLPVRAQCQAAHIVRVALMEALLRAGGLVAAGGAGGATGGGGRAAEDDADGGGGVDDGAPGGIAGVEAVLARGHRRVAVYPVEAQGAGRGGGGDRAKGRGRHAAGHPWLLEVVVAVGRPPRTC